MNLPDDGSPLTLSSDELCSFDTAPHNQHYSQQKNQVIYCDRNRIKNNTSLTQNISNIKQKIKIFLCLKFSDKNDLITTGSSKTRRKKVKSERY